MATVDKSGAAFAVWLTGVGGHLVQVRATPGGGPGPSGLLDRLAVAETTDRVRAAVLNCALPWPHLPVALSLSAEAHLATLSGADLAVACAVLAAAGHLPDDWLAETVLVGELSLDGQLRPVRGVLAAVLAARRAGLRRVVVPHALAAEAALVPDMLVLAAQRLDQVVGYARGEHARLPAVGPTASPAPCTPLVDLAEVADQPDAVAALEVAAAGGHHLLLLGRPVSTSRLAHCLPGLLPDLSADQALEVTAIQSIAGLLPAEAPLITRPPFVTVSPSASVPELLGGGIGLPRPGAVSRAHHGVLFLEQAAEFGQQRLEALRTVLDDGEIRLARRDAVVSFPARCQLVLASLPCRCGSSGAPCVCSASARRRYLARLVGPLLDRVELRVRLQTPVPSTVPHVPAMDSAAVVLQRVRQARQRAARRWAARGAGTNAEVSVAVLRRESRLPDAVTAPLDQALATGALTRRGADRTLRVAWTLADLAGHDQPDAEHVLRALHLRDRRPPAC
ncbi:ATP-binding protein [Actinophytocola sp.]|uniref:ATP-binding protein n=1 Tax=Actinophytocola sp. TaxID=1872138 RepID=UPI002D7FAF1D|nr:ATP-binding protein [Actinophytocola sp.]HET9141396.1 ATP-binding protein [Actinophytocola sp.]